MAIAFHFQTSRFSLPRNKIKDWLLLSAFMEHKEVVDIQYVFCDDQYLLELNNKFLHHNTYTDIVTFDDSSRNALRAEIYISVDRVRENARNFDTTFKNELLRVMIHGVLHCMGYDDHSQKDKQKIQKKENEYLKLFSEMK